MRYLISDGSRHFKQDTFKYTIYHGQSRRKLRSSLASFDIVFTTYETLKADILDSSKSTSTASDTLEGIQWGRIVLDEGNANSKKYWK